MSQTGVVAWSQIAATNSTADSNVNWAEGMAPSAVNDSARQEMASVAKYRDDQAGSLTTGGTTTAYTLTTNQVFSSLTVLNGQSLRVRFNATNGASPTLNVDSLGAKAIQSASGTAIGTGVLLANSVWDLVYDNSIPAFIVEGAALVQTGALADNSVTLPKLAAQADGTVVGNISGGSAAPVALTISGAALSGTTITVPHPPISAFSNISIKVASNTTVTVAADFVTVASGTNYQTLAFSTTINLGTTGAGALDTGSIASGTWYAIWAIANAGGTTSCIASTSSTSPTMPSGYTYKARVGWVRTAGGVAQLMGTWQLGRSVQYVTGLAQTTIIPNIAHGVAGTWSATSPVLANVSVSGLVPSTASAIRISASNVYSGGANANVIVAPNTSWGGTNNGPEGSAGTVYPIFLFSTNAVGAFTTLMLEGTNISWASDATGGGISCLGWEDNI